ncbi:MAG: hypothetical protein MUP74_01660, partial [Desulfobacterales bacterium]|nr:hypothetical protein [Desulfobacterales bacterium]
PGALSPEQSRWALDASAQPHFDVIAVDPEKIPDLGKGAHSFWYDNPWVSSDVLLKFLFHLNPAQRGLEENRTEKGLHYWTFPEDYPRRIIEIVSEL